jgi:FdrA protein
MGPDCGTAIIDEVGFGFTNAVRRGPVGLVGAAGTGMQEVMCLLDRADVGVSHAIGVGGRDLSAVVGGEMTLQGLARLEADPMTEVAVVVAKAPAAAVQPALLDAARAMSKPVVLALLGSGTDEVDGDTRVVHSLEAGAREAARLVGHETTTEAIPDVGPPRSGSILGLFCGGSLCQESMNVAAAAGADAAFVDFGDESFTDGRAHPMIDPSIRNRAFERGASDPGVAVVLLDVVLGRGAHLDPVGDLGPLIHESIDRRPDLLVVVSVCGVPGDPQDLDTSVKRLRESGAAVSLTAAHAARTAVAVVGAEP